MSTNKIRQDTENQSYKAFVLLFEIAVLVSSFYYIQLHVDTIAKYLGYPVAMFVVPAIVSGLIALLIGRMLGFENKKNTKFTILTAIMSVAPVTIFLLFVSFSSGPL
jgi:hypothetical protein